MHQSVMTEIKNDASEVCVVLDAFIKHIINPILLGGV